VGVQTDFNTTQLKTSKLVRYRQQKLLLFYGKNTGNVASFRDTTFRNQKVFRMKIKWITYEYWQFGL